MARESTLEASNIEDIYYAIGKIAVDSFRLEQGVESCIRSCIAAQGADALTPLLKQSEFHRKMQTLRVLSAELYAGDDPELRALNSWRRRVGRLRKRRDLLLAKLTGSQLEESFGNDLHAAAARFAIEQVAAARWAERLRARAADTSQRERLPL